METTNIKKQRSKKTKTKSHSRVQLDLDKFFGKIKWGEDPVKYQRELRDGK